MGLHRAMLLAQQPDELLDAMARFESPALPKWVQHEPGLGNCMNN